MGQRAASPGLVADAQALLRHITGASHEQFLLDIERQMSYTGFDTATATTVSGTTTSATSNSEEDCDSSVIEALLAATRSCIRARASGGGDGNASEVYDTSVCVEVQTESVPRGQVVGSPGAEMDDGDEEDIDCDGHVNEEGSSEGMGITIMDDSGMGGSAIGMGSTEGIDAGSVDGGIILRSARRSCMAVRFLLCVCMRVLGGEAAERSVCEDVAGEFVESWGDFALGLRHARMEEGDRRDIYVSIVWAAAVQGVSLFDGPIYMVEAGSAGGSGVRQRSWGPASRLGV